MMLNGMVQTRQVLMARQVDGVSTMGTSDSMVSANGGAPVLGIIKFETSDLRQII